VGAAGWYPAGWRRRPRGVRPAALLPLHLAAMCAVTAGQLAGLARDLIPAPAAAPAPRR
jgi:hypothetical protein